MRRYWASFILFIGVIFTATGQTTTVFTENFELPSGADSVTSFTSGVSGGFSINTTYAAGGSQSILGTYGSGDTTFLTTDPFSTLGNTFILLNFDHIAKIEFFDRAIIQVSGDGGATWNTLSCPEYLGSGQFCGGGNKFTSVSYTDWQPANPAALPTASWWKSETFDISAYASNTANAQVRFVLNDLNFSGQSVNLGWLIDNIMIEVAPCELVLPSVSFVQPTFQNIAYTTGPFDISVTATDNSGIDTSYIVYTLNGGAPDTVGMPNTSGNTFTGSIPAANVGDSICYYVVVIDASPCGNISTVPSSGSLCFIVDNAPPAFCVGVPESTFPYLEDFSSFTTGSGSSGTTVWGSLNNNWQRNPGSGIAYGWAVRSGTTGSANTGPNADNTLGNSFGKYMYTEGNMTGSPATLTSPCLDFENLTNPTLEFYYHMFGNNIGTLEVQVFDGNSTNTVWSLSGSQQSASSDPFEKVTIPLGGYSGEIVQVIFRATRGNGSLSDIAIDDVRVYEPQPNDISTLAIISPAAVGCDLSAAENVTVQIANTGTLIQGAVPMAYVFNGGATVLDTFFGILNPGDTTLFTFGQTVDLSAGGTTYTLDVWSLLPNEQTPENDSILGYSVTNTLTTTPVIEDFTGFNNTNTLNDWAQVDNDNFDWRFRTGNTLSANTGPTADHTTGTGVYAHIEANDASSGDVAILESPCLDFDTLIAPKMEFYYHMWGGTIGTLNVDILDANLNWINVWSMSGDQGNQWNKATVNLASGAGFFTKIRFRAVASSCCTGDIAIDDILIYEPQPDDMGVVNFISPSGSGCGYTSTTPITVEVVNLGTAPQSNIPVSYAVDGGTPVVETISQTILPGDTLVYTFTTTADFSTIGQTYDIISYTGLANDSTFFNDTIPLTFTHEFTISAFPYTEDFESGVAGGGTPVSPGTLPANWLRDPVLINTSQTGWLVNNGTTTSGSTGPDGDHTPSQNGQGNYVYFEVSYGGTGFEASLISPCIDFGSLTNPHVEFYYHRYGTQMGDFFVDALVGNTWVPFDTITIEPQTSSNAAYVRHVTQLTGLGGQDTKVRFRIISQGCCAGDMAIDDIKFYEPVPNDLAVISILQPQNFSPAGTANTVEVEIINFGLSTITTSPVEYSVNGGPVVTETWTGSLAPQATTTYTFNTTFNAPAGQYDICAWTDLVGEQAPLNDTTCKTATGVQTIEPTYFTDFENGQGSWVSSGGFNQWEYGSPTANTINNAYSGTNVWATNLDGNYLNNSDDFLFSPFFDFSSVIECELRFYHWWNFEGTWDGGRIEYSTNGGTSWTTLGSQTTAPPTATNWYNSTGNLISSGQPGWTLSSSQWEFSSYDLDFLNNNIGLVQFRFNISSDGSVNNYNGWAIDDFEVFAPIQLSAATSTINIPPSNNFILPSTKTVSAWVKNTGVVPLSSTDVTLEADGTVLVTDPLNFSVPLQIGDSILHTFSATWNATPGPHTLCVYTSSPNNSTESFVPDDTTCLTVTVFDAISSYPYCNDFETTLPPLVTLNAYSYDPNSNWQIGMPTKSYLNDTYSGQNAWVTGLTDDYSDRDSSALFTPLFDVNNTNCYRLSFYHKYKTELYQDGGIVEYSTDAGDSWTVLGGYQSSPNWYNNQYTIGLGTTTPGLPGWSGTSSGTNGWEYSEFDVLFDNPSQVIFRFRFGSDFSVTDEGWAIDDICFDEIPPCSPTSVEEYNTAFFVEAYPNPTSGNVNVTIESPIAKTVQFELVNMLGQTVFVDNSEINAGETTVRFDFNAMNQGMYYLRMIDGTETVNQKIVITD